MTEQFRSDFHPRNKRSLFTVPALFSSMRRESGQSMLEVALCLPLFFILILGTAEIASVAWSAVQVENAARAGAQFGAQSRAAAADTTDIATAAENDAPRLAALPTPMAVASTQYCQCINTSTGATAGTGCTTITQCPAPFVIMDYVKVNTSVTVTPIVHFPGIHYLGTMIGGLPATYTLKGQAIMGVEK